MTKLDFFFDRSFSLRSVQASSVFIAAVCAFCLTLISGLASPTPAHAERSFFGEDGLGAATPPAARFASRSRRADTSATSRPRAKKRVALRRSATRRSAGRPRLTTRVVKTQRTARVASIGPGAVGPSLPSLTGGSVAWQASASCLAGNLRSLIEQVSGYGRVTVNSTCRSRARNRSVGGAGKSWHLTGNAADIRISGNLRAAAAFLRNSVGGFKHYGGGLFHIDNGPKRRF